MKKLGILLAVFIGALFAANIIVREVQAMKATVERQEREVASLSTDKDIVTDGTPSVSDAIRARIAIMQRDLNGNNAELNRIIAEANRLQAVLEKQQSALNAELEKLQRPGWTVDPQTISYIKAK